MVLVGEAAQAYITYKYIELAVILVLIAMLGFGCYKMFKLIK